ncbi:Uncharacterised protein [uncultured archaeon]|nr:Uncharacterised protein [uncultured archaeon]
MVSPQELLSTLAPAFLDSLNRARRSSGVIMELLPSALRLWRKSVAFGAIPFMDALMEPLPSTEPLTWVPWPCRSFP